MLLFAFSEKFSDKLHLEETPPRVFYNLFKSKKIFFFLTWGGGLFHAFGNNTQIFFCKYDLFGFSNLHNFILLWELLITLFWRVFTWKKDYNCGQNIWNKVKIKQNQTGTEDFHIFFCVIFYSYHQSFQILPKFLNS